jgi:hypothetical protein
MVGDHPIFDGPFGSSDHLPTFVEIGDRRFEIELEWKVLSRPAYEGDEVGWIATTKANGKTYSGTISSPLKSLLSLAEQLNADLNLGQHRFTTELPFSPKRLHALLTTTARQL